jgi:hypothetical protein
LIVQNVVVVMDVGGCIQMLEAGLGGFSGFKDYLGEAGSKIPIILLIPTILLPALS